MLCGKGALFAQFEIYDGFVLSAQVVATADDDAVTRKYNNGDTTKAVKCKNKTSDV